jgi:hypothetical protein
MTIRYTDEDFDSHGVLRDGHSIRVTLHDAAMSRSGTRQQQQPLITDGRSNDAMAMHRPGFRIRTGDTRQPVRDAYADYQTGLVNAYRVKDGEVQCPHCMGSGEINGEDCLDCDGSGIMPEPDAGRPSKGAGKGYGSGNEGGYKGTAGDAAARQKAVEDSYRAYDADLAQAYRNG